MKFLQFFIWTSYATQVRETLRIKCMQEEVTEKGEKIKISNHFLLQTINADKLKREKGRDKALQFFLQIDNIIYNSSTANKLDSSSLFVMSSLQVEAQTARNSKNFKGLCRLVT
eukprot:XP_010656330.1 PREDICTED: uncharacterized protein LOC104880646 [Vitis vinifera]